MRGPLRRLALALALLLAAAAPARPADPVERLTEEAARFTGSAMVFVFLHELGHALIDLLDLPTVGREEDVVDEFAAWVLLKGAREAGGQDAQVAIEALVLAAESWRLLWKGTEGALRRGRAFPWWDEHSLDIQRYYNILCLIYGSDPGRFWPLVVKAEMPVPRARKCEVEYAQKEKAWERLFAGKYVPEGQPRPAGEYGRLRLLYGETRSAFGRELEEGMRQSGGFAQMVDALNEVLLLPPGEIPVIAQDCGFANAYWSGDEQRIVLCWEMFRFFLDAWIEEAKAQARQGAGPGPQPQPQPQPQPPGPPVAGLDMGPLQPLLRTGRDGPWTLAVEAGRFLLRNPGDADNLWRMFVPGEPPPAGRRRVALTVAAEGAPQGRGGGVAYGVEEAAERAFYLLLDGSGGLALRAEAREGGGLVLSTLRTWPGVARPGASVRLELVEQGTTLTVLADGRPLGTLAEQGFGRGAVGIAAWGTGSFAFSGFALADAAQPQQQPQPSPLPQPQPPPQPQPFPQSQPFPPPQPGPPPPPPSPPPPPAAQIDPQLVGAWTAWPSDAQGRRTTIRLELLEDGRYLETSWLPSGLVQRVWGLWRGRDGRLGLQPQGWDPTQSCDPQGCRPTPPPRPQDLVYRLLAGTSLQLGPHLFYRGP